MYVYIHIYNLIITIMDEEDSKPLDYKIFAFRNMLD